MTTALAPLMLAPSPLAAAHSMDTSWFAVDDDGRVAQFDSGECGAVPFAALDAGMIEEVHAYVDELGSRAAVVEHGDDDWAPLDPYDAARRGLYHYRHATYESLVSTPYTRRSRPLEPLRVDELPERVRGALLRFEGARFECDPLLQPLDFFAGRAHSDVPFVSVTQWALRVWNERRCLLDLPLDQSQLELADVPAGLLRWDAAEAVIFLANVVPNSRELTDRLTDEYGLHRSPVGPDGARKRLRSPVDSTAGPMLRALSQPVLAAACDDGRLPFSWRSDHGDKRRFACHADDWMHNAMFEDRRDDNHMMSLPFLPARVLEKLADDLPATLEAERLARDERRANTVYYREASAHDLRVLRELRRAAATERERAIFDLGFALDPLVSWAAVLWVNTAPGAENGR